MFYPLDNNHINHGSYEMEKTRPLTAKTKEKAIDKNSTVLPLVKE